MTTHYLQLTALPFSLVASGDKTIESRLYDEKRQSITVGDTIIFTNRDSPDETITARVAALLRYDTFCGLFESADPHAFGGKTVGQLEEQINEFYTLDQQEQYGVVGIKFELG